MTTRPACLVSYFAAWNAREIDAIGAHVRAAFGANTRYVDPHRVATGVEEFTASVAQFRAQSPEAIISWASEVDSHHHLHRYAWQLHVGEKLVVAGYDVVEVDDAQKIVSVLSFFGPLPELAAA